MVLPKCHDLFNFKYSIGRAKQKLVKCAPPPPKKSSILPQYDDKNAVKCIYNMTRHRLK